MVVVIKNQDLAAGMLMLEILTLPLSSHVHLGT